MTFPAPASYPNHISVTVKTVTEWKRAWWYLWLKKRKVGRKIFICESSTQCTDESHPNCAQFIFLGDEWDGASTPILLRGFASAQECFNGGAWHDMDYQRQECTRAEADHRFWWVLKNVDCIAPFRARIAWLGVRLGGWHAWRQNAKKKERKEEKNRNA